MWDAPGHRGSAWAHRAELTAPRPWGEALADWAAVHRDHGVPAALVTLEVAAEAAWPAAPERLAPTRWWGLWAPELPDGAPPGVALAPADPLEVARWLAAERPAEGPAAALVVGAWLAGLAARGATTWVATAGGVPIGTATGVPHPAGGPRRLQEVHVARGWRRRGVGRALVAAAAGGGPAVAMAAEGPAATFYRAIGFAPRSRLLAVRALTDRCASAPGPTSTPDPSCPSG